MPLLDKADSPPAAVPQAVALLGGLRTERAESGLEILRRRLPRFADYATTYLAGVASVKRPSRIRGARCILA